MSKKIVSQHRGGNPNTDAPIRLSTETLNSIYAPRQTPLPRPTPDIFDSPFVCLRINLSWLPHLFGALSTLTEWDAWTGDDFGYSGRMQIEELLYAMTRETGCTDLGENLLLRQNPTNNCQLQQSQDGGLTWTLAFDYSKCKNRSQTIINNISIDNSSKTFVENNSNEWNDSSQNLSIFAPTVIYDGNNSANDLKRDQALCYAIQVLMSTFREALLQADDPFIDLGAIAVGILSVIGIGLSGGAALPVIVGGIVSSGVGQRILNALGDAGFGGGFDAQYDDIVCYIYTNMKGETPSQTNFQNSFDGYPDATLEAIFTPLFDDLDIYLLFIRAIEEAYGISEYAELPSCPCEEWEFIVNFEQSDGGFTPFEYNSYFPATWQTGVGWVGGYLQDFGIARGLTACWIYKAFSQPTTLTYAEFTYTRTRGQTGIPAATDRVQDGAGTFIVNEPWTTATSPISWTGEETVTDLYCLIRSGVNNTNSSANPGGQAIVKTATIRGTGFNPFA
jgi:hypothetical protein